MTSADPIPNHLTDAPIAGEPTVALADAEAALLVRHREGDDDAFAELVERYRRPVWSYLARCGVEHAEREDLFQEVFVKIHGAVDRFDASRPGHPWIFTIVANTVRHHLRKRKVRDLISAAKAKIGSAGDESLPEIEPADPSPAADRRTGARQILRRVADEMGRLDPIRRQIVLLSCVEHLPHAQIAEALDLPVNTVKTHLRRARLALAKALQGGGLAPGPTTNQPIGGVS